MVYESISADTDKMSHDARSLMCPHCLSMPHYNWVELYIRLSETKLFEHDK